MGTTYLSEPNLMASLLHHHRSTFISPIFCPMHISQTPPKYGHFTDGGILQNGSSIAVGNYKMILRAKAKDGGSGIRRRIVLDEKEMPRQWYNIVSDLEVRPPPPLNPQTREILQPQDLLPIFPEALIQQEMSTDAYIDIPDQVMDLYSLWRPTPLFRALELEKLLQTPARIYYKYEGGSPAGSHKANTAVPQAWYNAKEGVKKVTTETGAGQWGSALAFACRRFGLECEVWQVRASYDQKPYRKTMMQTWGAQVHPSPSPLTKTGLRILDSDPHCPGSLGIAVSEALETALADPHSKYCLGSVLNHVLLHQTIIGEECLRQLKIAGETAPPDIVIGCAGGGSNFSGLAFPFLRQHRLRHGGGVVPPPPVFLAVEPAACPSLTRGVYAYDYGDAAGMTPLFKMHTLGHEFVPDSIHAGGLRYHGMAPLLSHLYHLGLLEALAIPQIETFQAAIDFARTEGIISAPEPAHAIAAAMREARKCAESGEEKVIVMSVCGHGHFDLAAYEKYMSGKMVDLVYTEGKLSEARSQISPNG